MLNVRNDEIHRYWSGLRHMRSAPLRSDFDPAAVRRRLPDLFMLDWQATELTFRLAGTRICELFGTELRGEAFTSLWLPTFRDAVMEAALSALRTEEAVVLDLHAFSEDEDLAFEMLLMPLRSSPRFADRLLGALFPASPDMPGLRFHAAALTLQNWLPVNALMSGQEVEDPAHQETWSPSPLPRFRGRSTPRGR